MAWIKWKQEKPPHIDVDIPLLPMLRDELALHSFSAGSTFLAPQGKDQARSKKAFGSLFARWADEAGVKPRLHGFRKDLASILPEMDLSNYHINVLLGHELGSVASNVYTRGARRREIARELNEQWEKLAWE